MSRKRVTKIKTRKDIGDLLMVLARSKAVGDVYLPPDSLEDLMVLVLCHLAIQFYNEQPYYDRLLEIERLVLKGSND